MSKAEAPELGMLLGTWAGAEELGRGWRRDKSVAEGKKPWRILVLERQQRLQHGWDSSRDC